MKTLKTLLLIFGFAFCTQAADKMILAKGQWYFEKKCAFCHKEKGQGDVGPNLTDDYYIYGNTKEAIDYVVRKGLPNKGMPVWEKLVPKDQLDAIVEYVYSIRGTNLKGKEPQGVLLKAKK
ncbi:MAG: cytochrome c [Lentisphaeraceae bacterium]|nr:cytochrome c [Lentisphaeraceae bacterium]